MKRTRPRQQAEGWSYIKSPKMLQAFAERYDEVELYQRVSTSAMMTALSTPKLHNGERQDLIHKLWVFAADRFSILQATPTLAEKAVKARNYIDAFATACLDASGHYEFYDKADPDRSLRELGNRLSRGW